MKGGGFGKRRRKLTWRYDMTAMIDSFRDDIYLHERYAMGVMLSMQHECPARCYRCPSACVSQAAQTAVMRKRSPRLSSSNRPMARVSSIILP